jgi:hypothetical protein
MASCIVWEHRVTFNEREGWRSTRKKRLCSCDSMALGWRESVCVRERERERERENVHWGTS